MLEHQVDRVQLESGEKLEVQDHLDLKDLKDSRARRALKERLGQLDQLELPGHKVLRDLRVLWDQQVLLE